MKIDSTQENIRKKKGRLSSDIKMKLEALIDKRGQLEGGFEGDIGKNRVRKIAEELSIDKRTVDRHVKMREVPIPKPDAADIYISYQKAILIEGVRLISTPVTNIVSCMKKYLPNLRIPALMKMRKNKGIDNKPLGSEGTYYNWALKCFDTGDTHTTVDDLRTDKELVAIRKNSLKRWPPGTVAIHSVTLDYQLSRPTPDTPRNRGSRILLMLMVVRTNAEEKDLAFSVLPLNCKDSDKITDIKEYLESLTTPPTSIRLVSKVEDGNVVPTAISREKLQEAIGDNIPVELDEPTHGHRDSFRISHKRFPSKKAVEEYLYKLYVHGYPLK